MSGTPKSLSEKISELINPTPVWEDPENDYSETAAKLVERSDEFLEDDSTPRTTLKISKGVLLDEDDKRYKGKKVSRRKYEEESSDQPLISSDVDDSAGDESSGSESLSEASASDSESGEESDAQGSLSSEDGTENVDIKSENDTFQSFKGSSFSSEVEKANAVRNQIRMWDNLLEVRIQLQKCLVAANKLPPHDSLDSFKRLAGSEFQTQLTHCKQEGLTLLNNLVELQNVLLSLNSETRSVSSGKKRKEEDEEEIPSDEGDCSSSLPTNENSQMPKKKRKLSDISKEINDQHVNFRGYRDDTLQKWYLRSKVATVKSSNFSAFDLSILKQIEHVMRDKEALIKRTQKKRSSYRAIGVSQSENEVEDPKADEEYDCEIYDDDDFYHKLLRELIERKSADVADPTQLGRQWSELQKLRRKLKKKVDTKASKGRKLRYIVHSKLVNFMAPVPYAWNDSAMDDLFRSLFGKVE